MSITPNSEKEQPPTWRYWTGFMGLFIVMMLLTTQVGSTVWPDEPLQRRYLGTGVIVASLVAAASMWLAVRALSERPGAFVQGILGGTLLRLFVGVVGVVIVALVAKAYLIAFVAGFFGGYFVFTAFEVWALLHILRRVSKTPGSPST
jgi:hypothetical protein